MTFMSDIRIRVILRRSCFHKEEKISRYKLLGGKFLFNNSKENMVNYLIHLTTQILYVALKPVSLELFKQVPNESSSSTCGRIGNNSNSGRNSNTINSNSNEGKPLFESLLGIPYLHAFFQLHINYFCLRKGKVKQGTYWIQIQ